MEFKNSIEFFNYCQELYLKLLEEQYPDMEQGSGLHNFALKSLVLLRNSEFLIPNTCDYYALEDSSIYLSQRDDRLLFIEDMKNAEDIFMFILTNSRGYTNEKDGLHWRRVPVWDSKKQEWKQKNNIV
jgi:hypothetical protein